MANNSETGWCSVDHRLKSYRLSGAMTDNGMKPSITRLFVVRDTRERDRAVKPPSLHAKEKISWSTSCGERSIVMSEVLVPLIRFRRVLYVSMTKTWAYPLGLW